MFQLIERGVTLCASRESFPRDPRDSLLPPLSTVSFCIPIVSVACIVFDGYGYVSKISLFNVLNLLLFFSSQFSYFSRESVKRSSLWKFLVFHLLN